MSKRENLRLRAVNSRLQNENDRLRKLVKHLYTCDGNCIQCPYWLSEDLCDFERQMTNLGIEVRK